MQITILQAIANRHKKTFEDLEDRKTCILESIKKLFVIEERPLPHLPVEVIARIFTFLYYSDHQEGNGRERTTTLHKLRNCHELGPGWKRLVTSIIPKVVRIGGCRHGAFEAKPDPLIIDRRATMQDTYDFSSVHVLWGRISFPIKKV